jgi:methyl-accepting chemotaxis protein
MIERVSHVASDLEAERREAAWNAISRSQSIIEFGLDGVVLWANQLFLEAMGYSLSEITGRHHRMFCDPAYAASSEYTASGARLVQVSSKAGSIAGWARMVVSFTCGRPIIR